MSDHTDTTDEVHESGNISSLTEEEPTSSAIVSDPADIPNVTRGLSASVHEPALSPILAPLSPAQEPSAVPIQTPLKTPTKQTSLNELAQTNRPTPTPTPKLTASTSTSTETPLKTPNVYINGLPPHFPEDELFALTAPYGDVRSVRSFTRHIGERSSGYGFVLFDTVESAERCIDGLRRYRNLHPSFSKQIHKIPGTVYASLHTNRTSHTSAEWSTQGSESGSMSVGENCESDSVTRDGGEGVGGRETFKARMERLRDESSTNLYIEGLPLSIDDATLAALVSPYAIKSSRFFQTKLSHPPRIIAFVRLETRTAAEEIIERLHGRMVRGWNDPGSRISVRFADTNEQRELRRTERSGREGTQSPARLTIAQASLLNLRGNDIQVNPAISSPARRHHDLSPAGSTAFHSGSGPVSSSASICEYNALGRRYPAEYPPQIRSHLPGLDCGSLSAVANDYHNHYQGSGLYPHLQFNHPQPPQQEMTSDMAILLDSLRKGGTPFTGRSQAGGLVDYDGVLRTRAQSFGLPVAGMEFYPSAHVPVIGQAQARNGFTPAEEIILQAHARARGGIGVEGSVFGQMQNTTGGGLSHADTPGTNINIGMGVRGRRSVASTLSFRPPVPQGYTSMIPPIDLVPSMPPLQDDFYPNAVLHRPSFDNSSSLDARKNPVVRVNHSISHSTHIDAPHPPREFDPLSVQQQQYEHQPSAASYSNVRTQTKLQNPKHNTHPTHAPHMRSTTLPHSSSTSQASNQHQRHFQHSSLSMSIPTSSDSNSTNTNPNRNQNPFSISNQNSATFDHSNSNSINFDINDHSTASTGGGLPHYQDDAERISNNIIKSSVIIPTRDHELAHFTHSQPLKHRDDTAFNSNHNHDSNLDLSAMSPPIVSPALTYSSSSRTPATLSPSTPFFSSFGSSIDLYDGPLRHGVGVERNLKKMSPGNVILGD